MGLTPLMGIGTSALAAFQRALAVTGHNISNVNTPGYSRQDTTLTEADPQNGRPGQIGSGVQASEIRRSVDTFVEQQLLTSHERQGQFEASRNGLVRVQTLFGDSNDQGLAAGLNQFFSAWQDVATNPSDASARTVLLAKAESVATQFNQKAVELTAQRHRHAVDVMRRVGRYAVQRGPPLGLEECPRRPARSTSSANRQLAIFCDA